MAESDSTANECEAGSLAVESLKHCTLVRLNPANDPTNRLTRKLILELSHLLESISAHSPRLPLILAGNETFFSAGADLNEIAALNAAHAYEFAQMGQSAMNSLADHPAGAIAAIRGYCLGGGLDIALACHYRIANPKAILGHRGAALGIITGWGGTQRLPRLIGKARALQVFLEAEKIHSPQALAMGLIQEISDDPVRAAMRIAESGAAPVS